MVDVLLADNQPLTAAGLVHILGGLEDVSVAGEVTDRESFLPSLKKLQPALLLVDYNLPGYISRLDLQKVKEVSPRTNVLVVSADDDKKSILDVLQAGVLGYLTKDCSRDEIIMAVYSVTRGEKFFCQKILDIIMQKHFNPEPPEVLPGILTTRETEILTLIAHGKSTQTIADELYLSPHTVHTHRKSIIKKLNVKSPTEFVIHALDMGLLKTR